MKERGIFKKPVWWQAWSDSA